MHIGVLQFDSTVGKTVKNMKRADGLLRGVKPGSLDILALPEMAFSGYYFPTHGDIRPFLEPTCAGVTTMWAQRTAQKLRCYVQVGYPEETTDGHRYTSCVLVDSRGAVVSNYRKTFLFYQDEIWAEEGVDGFYAGHVDHLGPVAIGICMDLNPRGFRADWTSFEFAGHVVAQKAKLVLMALAWVTTQPKNSFDAAASNEADLETVDYWMRRFQPLRSVKGETIVVMANQCGSDAENVYAGSSGVFRFADGVVETLGVCGRQTRQLLVVDTADK